MSTPTRFYVYAPSYPDGQIFYIGKGRGKRTDRHEGRARAGIPGRHLDIIRAILTNGEQ